MQMTSPTINSCFGSIVALRHNLYLFIKLHQKAVQSLRGFQQMQINLSRHFFPPYLTIYTFTETVLVLMNLTARKILCVASDQNKQSVSLMGSVCCGPASLMSEPRKKTSLWMCVMNKNKNRFYLIVFLLKASNNLTPRGEMCVCMNMNFL